MPVRCVARMARWPAGPSGLWPGPVGLTAELVGLYKSRGEAFPTVFFHFSSSPRPPPSPWPLPPQACPPPSLSTQPISSKLRSGVDRVVLKLSTDDLCVSSTALGDRDLSSSSFAPCLRVTPFYLLFLLALASHSVCSCYCMSRSRVYLGLDPFV
jgi:hypothetical protein